MKVRLTRVFNAYSEDAVKMLSADEQQQLKRTLFRKLAENEEMRSLLKTTKSKQFTPQELNNALIDLECQRDQVNRVLGWIPKQKQFFTPKQIADSLRREAASTAQE